MKCVSENSVDGTQIMLQFAFLEYSFFNASKTHKLAYIILMNTNCFHIFHLLYVLSIFKQWISKKKLIKASKNSRNKNEIQNLLISSPCHEMHWESKERWTYRWIVKCQLWHLGCGYMNIYYKSFNLCIWEF